jgi:hypothetical protein
MHNQRIWRSNRRRLSYSAWLASDCPPQAAVPQAKAKREEKNDLAVFCTLHLHQSKEKRAAVSIYF